MSSLQQKKKLRVPSSYDLFLEFRLAAVCRVVTSSGCPSSTRPAKLNYIIRSIISTIIQKHNHRNTDLGTGWLASFIQKFPLHIISLPSLCMTLCNPAAGVGGAPDSGKEQVDIVFNFFRLARKLKVIVSFQDASGGGWVTGCGTRGGWPTGLTTHELHVSISGLICSIVQSLPGRLPRPSCAYQWRCTVDCSHSERQGTSLGDTNKSNCKARS